MPPSRFCPIPVFGVRSRSLVVVLYHTELDTIPFFEFLLGVLAGIELAALSFSWASLLESNSLHCTEPNSGYE